MIIAGLLLILKCNKVPASKSNNKEEQTSRKTPWINLITIMSTKSDSIKSFMFTSQIGYLFPTSYWSIVAAEYRTFIEFPVKFVLAADDCRVKTWNSEYWRKCSSCFFLVDMKCSLGWALSQTFKLCNLIFPL